MGAKDELRQAATVMLVRDQEASGIEVLMLQRNLNSDFVGGAYVFPGGAVDPEDSGELVDAHVVGLSDELASARLELQAGGIAYWVAVLRELFEEAGVLLTAHDASTALAADPEAAIRLAAMRHELNARERSFRSIIEAEGLVLDVSEVHYFAHWITPEGSPRRYDTYFFVAEAPEGQEAIHDDQETVDTIWIDPLEALERQRRGEISIILPTIKNLQAIGRFTRTSELLEHARKMGEVPTILPRFTEDGGGLRLLLPGDEGYDTAAPPAGGAGAAFTSAVQAVSKAANEGTAP